MEQEIFRSDESLKELGFKHVYVVPEQELPDPEFTDTGLSEP